jgi:hypothetical protein
MEKRYKIELSEEQFQVYIEALEGYSRFLSGQIGNICNSVTSRKGIPYVMEWLDDPHGSNGVSILKKYLFPELSPNSSHGIGANDELQKPRQISYEMYRGARHFISKRDGDKNVYSSEGLNYSGIPEPKIIQIGLSEIREDKINKILEE